MSDDCSSVFRNERNERGRLVAKRVDEIRLCARSECRQVDGTNSWNVRRLLGSDAHDWSVSITARSSARKGKGIGTVALACRCAYYGKRMAWEREVKKAVRESDVVIVCLTRSSITKEGFVQKEIREALDVADEKPEDTIFVIPLKLEECRVPDRLRRWQWVNLFAPDGYDKLTRALHVRATALGIEPLKKETQPTVTPRRDVNVPANMQLSAEEVVILVAAERNRGEIIKGSSEQTGDYLLIGALSFPPDMNDPNPSPEAVGRWLEGFRLARTQGFVRHDEGDLYKITVSGYELVKKFRNSGKRTHEGADLWETTISCLSELSVAQDLSQNPLQVPATHEKIRQLWTRSWLKSVPNVIKNPTVRIGLLLGRNYANY